MALSRFLFFDETSTEATSNAMKLHDLADTVTLQVEGDDVDLTIQGIVDVENGEYANIGAIKMSNYSTVSSISSSGVYLIPATGIYYMRLVNNGAVGSVRAYVVSTR